MSQFALRFSLGVQLDAMNGLTQVVYSKLPERINAGRGNVSIYGNIIFIKLYFYISRN